MAARTKAPVKKAAAKTKPVKKPTAAGTSTPTARRKPIPSQVISPDDVKANIGEVPAPRRGASKSTKYRDVLAEVRKLGKGQAVKIATFAGRSGAGYAKRALYSGEYLCDGAPADWDLQARRNDDGSELWATLR